MPAATRVCGDCKLFDVTKGSGGACSWGLPECKSAKSDHAEMCPLFTDYSGYQPLLECSDEELPLWAKL